MKIYIPRTYKVSRPNLKPLFIKEVIVTIWNPTPLTNKADFELRNRYNKIGNKAKEKFSDHMRHKVFFCPNGSREIRTLAKLMNNIFNDSSFLPLTAEDGSIVTFSTELRHYLQTPF